MNTRRMNRLEELGRVDAERAKTRMGARNLKDEKKRIVRELKADGGKVKKSEHPLAGREGNVKHRLKSQKQYKAITDTKKYKDASYSEKNKMLAKGGAYTKSAPDKKGRTFRADGGYITKKKKPSWITKKETKPEYITKKEKTGPYITKKKKYITKKSPAQIQDRERMRRSEGGMTKGVKEDPRRDQMKQPLKKVKPSQKGLKKLPTKVRNKMGYMKKGGRVGMGKALRGGGCVR